LSVTLAWLSSDTSKIRTQAGVAMMISGHKTRSVFDRCNIVSEQDLTDAVRKLQKFQDAARPACQPAQAETSASVGRPAFVN
jgi:hypothetical protein